jgi:hypothetical protein
MGAAAHGTDAAMRLISAIIGLSLTCLPAGQAGPPGYLPQAGPAPLRFGPAHEVAWREARTQLAVWPALALVTLPRRDPAETNQPSAQVSWPSGTDPAAANASQPVVASSAPPPPPANPYLTGLVPTPEGGWWEILTNAPAAIVVTNGPAAFALPVAPGAYNFAPPAEAPRSRATFTRGP